MAWYRTSNSEVKNVERIVRNCCQCNVCKDIIESKSVHDWVQCKCGRIFTDGGHDYIHRGFVEPSDIIDLTEVQTFSLDKINE